MCGSKWLSEADAVDLWEYYERVEQLILVLRGSDHAEQADAVEIAIRGGATSGEILGRLSLALPEVAKAAPRFRTEVGELAAWTSDALRPR
jgi:hypothetical protein